MLYLTHVIEKRGSLGTGFEVRVAKARDTQNETHVVFREAAFIGKDSRFG